MFNLQAYRSEMIPNVWDRVKPHIERALDRGSNYNIDQILMGLCRQDMQLWVWQEEQEIKAALVTTIQNKEDKRWCLLLAIGGDGMGEWLEQLPLIEEWAREQGCQEMRIYGRRGWAKVTGYDIEWTKMSKPL